VAFDSTGASVNETLVLSLANLPLSSFKLLMASCPFHCNGYCAGSGGHLPVQWCKLRMAISSLPLMLQASPSPEVDNSDGELMIDPDSDVVAAIDSDLVTVIDSDLVAGVNSDVTAGAADNSDRVAALSPDVSVWAADGSYGDDGVVVIDMTCSGVIV
jgi:hypothetical protein